MVLPAMLIKKYNAYLFEINSHLVDVEWKGRGVGNVF